MIEYWNWFVTGFCKVEFLCHQAEPNWLGWIVIAFGVVIPIAVIGMIFDY